MTELALDRSVLKLAGVVVVGAITPLLDMTMVTVALARIVADFGAPVVAVQWVSAGYLLSIAVTIPTTGRLVERFGARAIWLTALAVFCGGSALCATSWSVGSLIAFRVLQGLGGGMIVPLTMMIMVKAAGPDRRGRVMSLVAIPAQLAPIAGPLLGGVVVDALGWQWIFLVNVPIGLIAIALAWRVVPADAVRRSGGPDLLGLALVSPAIALLVMSLSGTATWPAAITGVALLAAFVVRALRTTTPLLDLRLFGHLPVTVAAVLNFLSRFSVFGAMLLMPLYLQQVRGHSALEAGLLLAPQSLGTVLALPLVGRSTDRIGARPVALAGVGITVAATVAFTQVTATSSFVVLAIALLVWGIGIAAATVPVSVSAYHGLDPADIPGATSLVTTVTTIGASAGAAAVTSILQSRLGHHVGDPAAAFADTFWWILGLTAVTLLPATLLPGRDRSGGRPPRAV
ncbi:DHA2 family efflux MFS transporter permease subunit [Kribbella sp. NPDC051586]|uniref:DHA2 family efflux MFS transporter permease subunit n=1 Tax=Kribbella sp. NPDC051586 TaxID=3364118 RepID=UPI0037BA7275